MSTVEKGIMVQGNNMILPTGEKAMALRELKRRCLQEKKYHGVQGNNMKMSTGEKDKRFTGYNKTLFTVVKKIGFEVNLSTEGKEDDFDGCLQEIKTIDLREITQ